MGLYKLKPSKIWWRQRKLYPMSIQTWQCIVEKSLPSSFGGLILTRGAAQWQYNPWEAIKAHNPESSSWKCYLIRLMLYVKAKRVPTCDFVGLIRVLSTKPFNSHIMNLSLMENALSKYCTKTMRSGLKEGRFERTACNVHITREILHFIHIKYSRTWTLSSIKIFRVQ